MFFVIFIHFYAIAGVNEKFLKSLEVFDVNRGLWREFKNVSSNRTKFGIVKADERDGFIMFGGKDEYGIQSDEVEEFSIKQMKSYLADWKLPEPLSGFGYCQIKSKLLINHI